MKPLLLYTIAFMFSAVAALLSFFFVSTRFLNKTTVTGKILGYSKRSDPRDSEYDEYTIEYAYEVNGHRKGGRDRFSVNTVHMWYANEGGLDGVPKLTTKMEDMELMLQPGSPVYVIYVSRFPFLMQIKYEKHPNQLIDEQLIAEYKRAKRSV